MTIVYLHTCMINIYEQPHAKREHLCNSSFCKCMQLKKNFKTLLQMNFHINMKAMLQIRIYDYPYKLWELY